MLHLWDDAKPKLDKYNLSLEVMLTKVKQTKLRNSGKKSIAIEKLSQLT